MSKRSKYIVSTIIIVQPFTQIAKLIYVESMPNNCIIKDARLSDSLHSCLAIAVPFLVIITFNLATITALCRNRFRRHTVSGNRDHVHVFTRITILTGVSFVVSYSLRLAISVYFTLDLELDWFVYIAWPLVDAMIYFNSCMNPIICFVVCKSIHDDMKTFLKAVIRTVRRPCATKRSIQESGTTNVAQAENAV